QAFLLCDLAFIFTWYQELGVDPMATSDSSSINKSGFNPILNKLTESNFFTWQSYALFAIRGQNLQDHIREGPTPSQFESDATKASGTISAKYKE
ncbi:hypothetical protein PIB30_100637, partial [Stylosanthes scabra]|nr:hypothetical protein [Stylosanthes scabra]